ncbi:unnamed protein product [Caenorhabditis angaria]|uniref:PAN-3 domain-containing protein n=1 Tax=Caenorhabditis angaria TaxID=860376 RepID=A0A9P1NBU6_9PELO|nr:unnamed protein product [Caenorhabditis angaria]
MIILFFIFILQFSAISYGEAQYIVRKNECRDSSNENTYCIIQLEQTDGPLKAEFCTLFDSVSRTCKVTGKIYKEKKDWKIVRENENGTIIIQFEKNTTEKETIGLEKKRETRLRIIECSCTLNFKKVRRSAAVEELFGLKKYAKPSAILDEYPQKTLVIDGTSEIDKICGFLTLANPDKLISEQTASFISIKPFIIKSTHSTTSKNCWNLCKDNVFSTKKSCEAIALNAENSMKTADDCYLLSDIPSISNDTDQIFKIYEKCI